MSEETPAEPPSHASRARKTGRNRSLKVLPTDSKEAWPANLGELLEWYTNEVEDVTRAAQLRLRHATKVISDYREGAITFDEAKEAVSAHYDKWSAIFPGEIESIVRGQSDEKINAALDAYVAERKEEGQGRG